VQTHQINVSNGRGQAHEIRRELFRFPEVLEVFVTGRPDSLVVVYRGRPRPGEWLRVLYAMGYEPAARRHPSASVPEGERINAGAAADDSRTSRPVAASPRPGAGRRKIVSERSHAANAA
jgi:hypothetical protein